MTTVFQKKVEEEKEGKVIAKLSEKALRVFFTKIIYLQRSVFSIFFFIPPQLIVKIVAIPGWTSYHRIIENRT